MKNNISIKYFYSCLALTIIAVSSCYADWKSDANARIESGRKRNAIITVVDHNGRPISGMNVQMEEVKHRFAFGAAINNSYLNTSGYKPFILNHFEWGVCENDTKWQYIEPSKDVNTYTNADNIYNWCNSNEINMRGHCLFWEQQSNVQSWVQALSYATYPTSSALLTRVDHHILDTVNHYKNKFKNWDVDNEMLSDSFYNRLGANDEGRVHMYQYAQTVDANCGMFMNEYSGNSFGGYDATSYVNRANRLIALGAPIGGLGIQAHLGTISSFNAANYYSNVLVPLAAVGLPIWATEFDVNQPNDTTRANIMEDFFRICFSHPSVEGIMMWGFRHGATWQKDWWIVDSNYTLNAAGQRYEALLDEWTTADANITDPNGNAGFRGFHGTYEITLSVPGQTDDIHTIELTPGSTNAQFVLNTNLIQPQQDFNAPMPNPMTWASLPSASGSNSITMTATTATDENPPVQYYFQCTSEANKSSAWQTSPTYTATGLSPNTQYTFRVEARDNTFVSNVTGWSDTASATTLQPGIDIDILGSWTTDLSHPQEAGSNRALIFIAHARRAGVTSLISVTYGDQPMTKVMDKIVGTNPSTYVAAYILDEAGIAAATGNSFSADFGNNTPSYIIYSSAFFNGVDQNTPIGATDSNSITGSSPAAIETNSLPTRNHDMVIEAASSGSNGSYTMYNGFTEGTDETTGSSLTGVTGYKPASGANETPNATHSNPNNQVIIGFALQALASRYQDCNAVQAAGYGLPSDLNGDCYVDYEDLKIVADNWLNTDCGSSGNCGGADFTPTNGTVDFADFSNFAQEWMQCNVPDEPGCIINW